MNMIKNDSENFRGSIEAQSDYLRHDVNQFLNKIKESDPSLVNERDYQKIQKLI